MSKIRVMSEELSNRIAAGEVIERPASVVKEAVENAIDAGARRISVVAERAGSRLISVSDDGCGMDSDDVMLAIEPHGTSKLLSVEGLDAITTMGFRGEALPSIAAVSRFELYSRRPEDSEGTLLRVDGGKIRSAEPAGGPPGTRLTVRDLFFNTPARRKFLKSAATEENHITELMINLALANPEIGFELTLDNRRVWRLAPAPTEQRVRELFGRSFRERMLPAEHREHGWSLSGLVAEPGFTRIGRREQRIFINGRPVESPAIYRGIRDGYDAYSCETGRFPPVILHFAMPPEELDVNVHPAKREVRFRSEFAVTRFVAAAVSAALRRGTVGGEGSAAGEEESAAPLRSATLPSFDEAIAGAGVSYVPAARVQRELPLDPPAEPVVLTAPPGEAAPRGGAEGASCSGGGKHYRVELPPLPSAGGLSALTDLGNEAERAPRSAASVPETERRGEEERREELPELPAGFDWPRDLLGIYDASFLLCSGDHGLVIVDQHAAHERVLFEAIVADLERGAEAGQRLLLPATLELSAAQFNLMLRHRPVFERLGFEFEPAGGSTVLLNAVPVRLGSRRAPEEMIPDMLDELVEGAARHLPVEPAYAARAACKAACKAHEELTPEAARQLLADLRRCRQGTLCPHGRPIMITLTRRELEKRFFRR